MTYPIMANKDVGFVKIHDEKNHLFAMVLYFHMHYNKIGGGSIFVWSTIHIVSGFGEQEFMRIDPMFCDKFSVNARISASVVKKSFNCKLSSVIQSGYTDIDIHFFLFVWDDLPHECSTIIFA